MCGNHSFSEEVRVFCGTCIAAGHRAPSVNVFLTCLGAVHYSETRLPAFIHTHLPLAALGGDLAAPCRLPPSSGAYLQEKPEEMQTDVDL